MQARQTNTALVIMESTTSQLCMHDQNSLLNINGDSQATSDESTAGADASVEALKLYDMKLLTLAYLAR